MTEREEQGPQSDIGNDRTLLLVDDDQPFLRTLARAMEKRGFQPEMADSVATGKAIAKARPPAFAVVDLRLEDGNGLDVVEVLRGRPASPKPPSTPVLPAPAPVQPAVSPPAPASTPRRPRTLKSYRLWDRTYQFSSWAQLWIDVAEAVWRRHPADFLACALASGRMSGRKRRYIDDSKEGMHRGRPVGTSGYFVETNLVAKDCERRARDLLEIFGHDPDDLLITDN